jgi:hypothetical protein
MFAVVVVVVLVVVMVVVVVVVVIIIIIIIQGIRPSPSPFVAFSNMLIFYGEESLATRPTPSWRTTPCRLSAIAYLIYSQLSSISGGRLLQPQPKDAPCRGDMEAT